MWTPARPAVRQELCTTQPSTEHHTTCIVGVLNSSLHMDFVLTSVCTSASYGELCKPLKPVLGDTVLRGGDTDGAT
jgi:hypothetical protein